MSYNFFYKKLEHMAAKNFPSLSEIAPPNWDHLISPLELRLPKVIFERAQTAIQALHAVSRRSGYAKLATPVGGISDSPALNASVLMAYDFHTTESGECHLVEINTNASGFLLSSLMEMTHAESTTPASYEPFTKLHQAFAQELKLSGHTGEKPAIAITDEDIPQQKMYAEFLMYRDWFRAYGWSAEICESRDFARDGSRLQTLTGQVVDLVYNRLTDFYLESPQHSTLRAAFADGISCFSPNPKEYWLLADKQRLIQLSSAGFLESVGASTEEMVAIRRVLIPTFEKSAFTSSEEIWSQRRQLFFKPKRSYGGKSVYRGESVSKKVFERLMQQDVLIQHFTPAQKMPIEDPRSVLNNWKFDLRFYVYASEIQLVAARIYQGQVTNFASTLGGWTLVQFI